MNKLTKRVALCLRLIVIGVMAMTLFCFSACTGESGNTETGAPTEAPTVIPTEEPTEAPTEPPATEAPTEAPTEEPTEAPTEPVTAPPITYVHPSQYGKDDAGATSDIVLNIADYGVAGDGRTDDGPAISLAVRDAMKQNATLVFEEGKTYCIRSATNTAAPFHGAMAMQGATGVTLDGNGATFKIQPGYTFFTLIGCSNIRICNMIFDTIMPVYLVGTVESVNGTVVTYKTDIDPYVGDYNYGGVTAFSIKYNEGTQARPHMFLTRMKKTASKTVEVTYTAATHYQKGDVVFLPNPGVGHLHSEAIYLGGNSGSLTFENIQICAAPSFVFSIKGNDAEMYFENVDITPAETNTRDIQMVAWRDGFHCKDNRRPMHWNECDIGVIFDDCFNISNTLGYITEIKSDNCIWVTNYEFYGRGQNVGYNSAIGDIVDIYNNGSPRMIGTAKIVGVSNNANGTVALILEPIEPFVEELAVGCVVGNRMTNAPDSEITNSRFTGTFRFLRDLRVQNCTFDMLAMWCRVEGGVEGPLPGQLDFVECTFNGGSIEVGCDLRRLGEYVKDVGFWGCTFNSSRVVKKGKATVLEVDMWTESDLFTNADRELYKPEEQE